MSEDTWTEVELPDIVKDWEKGDSQEGWYEGMETIPYEGKEFSVYIFRRDDNTRWSTAASAGLKPLMKDVSPGTYTKLEMTGTKDTGQPAPMKVFKVLTRG